MGIRVFPRVATEKPAYGVRLNRGHPLAQNLVVAWLLNDQAAICRSIDGRFQNDGSYSGHWAPNGIKVTAASTERVGSIIQVQGGMASSVQGTVVARMARASGGLMAAGYGDGATTSRFNVLWFTDTNVYCQVEAGSASFPNFAWAGTDQMTTFAITFNGDRASGSRTRGYANGIQQTLSGTDSAPTALVSSGQSFWAGWDPGNGYGTGVCEFAYLYNRELTPSEIMWLYQQPYAFLQAPSTTTQRPVKAVAGGGGGGKPTLHYHRMWRQ